MSERHQHHNHHQQLHQQHLQDNVKRQQQHHQSIETTNNTTASTSSSKTQPDDVDWEQEKTKARVRQFMNILEKLPRLCSPTICGTLSQPTTRTAKPTRGSGMFEWSLEQKAILSPANITMDTEGTDEWQTHMAELNPSWRQQESEMFFSQRTIAPSPLITTPQTRTIRKQMPVSFVDNLVYDEDEEDEEEEDDEDEDEEDDDDDDNDDLEYMDNQQAQDLTTNNNYYNDTSNVEMNYSGKFKSYEFEDDVQDDDHHVNSDTEFDLGGESHIVDEGDNHNNDEHEYDDEHDEMHESHEELMDDNLFFSPQPLKSSQTQQRMDIFSPDTFVRVMEDENTLQSTPKTTGSLLRTRTRHDVID